VHRFCLLFVYQLTDSLECSTLSVSGLNDYTFYYYYNVRGI